MGHFTSFFHCLSSALTSLSRSGRSDAGIRRDTKFIVNNDMLSTFLHPPMEKKPVSTLMLQCLSVGASFPSAVKSLLKM